MTNLTTHILTMEDDTEIDTDFKDFYETAQFITGLILYPIICIVGMTGNILTLVVLGHYKATTSTNIFLSALAVADLIKLLNDTLYFIDMILMVTNPVAGNAMMGYMYPWSHYVMNQSLCVASWLTLSIGVERYLYVCHVSRAKNWCTVKHAYYISGAVFVCMSLVAIPSALRYKRITVFNPQTNRSEFDIGLTALGGNRQFMTVYMWIINLLRSVIPLCLLVVLNACIIQALRKSKVKGKITGNNRITFMLIVVIVVFLVCITPDAVMSTVFGFGYVEAGYLVKGIREFTDTLLAVNSAANFMIYCLCSQAFRDVFRQIFCYQKRSRGQANSRDVLAQHKRPLLGVAAKEGEPVERDIKELIELDVKAVELNGSAVSVYKGVDQEP